jgi:hypothetical protein
MISKSVSELSREIHQKGFFELVCSGVTDWDAVLDLRDGVNFDSLWVRNNEALKVVEYKDSSASGEIDSLREYAFKTVFGILQNAEVAGYISDDIGLIAEAISKGAVSEWVEGLLLSYQAGKFPY